MEHCLFRALLTERMAQRKSELPQGAKIAVIEG
jgi:hypothetical protein